MKKRFIPPIFYTKRIAVIAMLIVVNVVVRNSLSFIPGVEFTTFLTLVFAYMLPLVDSLAIGTLTIVISSFTLGFGNWLIAQFIYYPIAIIVIFGLRKVITNKFVLAIGVGFFAGPWVIFWYFLSDLLFFGKVYAIANIFSAVPIGFIQLTVNVVATILIFNPLNIVFAKTVKRMYDPYFRLNLVISKVKFSRIMNIIMGIILVLGSITGVYYMFTTTWYFVSLGQNYAWTNEYIAQEGLLEENEYSKIKSSLNLNEAGIVVIYGDRQKPAKLVGKIIVNSRLSLFDAVASYQNQVQELNGTTKFYFDYKNDLIQGNFLTSLNVLRYNKYTNQTLLEHWGGNYVAGILKTCPFLYEDSNFELLGAQKIVVKPQVVYQLSYNTKGTYENSFGCTYQ